MHLYQSIARRKKIIESHAWIKITVHAWLLFVIDRMGVWRLYSDFSICMWQGEMSEIAYIVEIARR